MHLFTGKGRGEMGGTEGWQGPGKITKSSEHSWEMSEQFVVLLRDRLYLSHTLSQTHTCAHTHTFSSDVDGSKGQCGRGMI